MLLDNKAHPCLKLIARVTFDCHTNPKGSSCRISALLRIVCVNNDDRDRWHSTCSSDLREAIARLQLATQTIITPLPWRRTASDLFFLWSWSSPQTAPSFYQVFVCLCVDTSVCLCVCLNPCCCSATRFTCATAVTLDFRLTNRMA